MPDTAGPRAAKGDPIQSPYVATFGDYLWDQATANPAAPDHAVMLTVTFDNTTRALTGATLWRAANCRWHTITIGTGADGSPNSSTKTFDLSGINDSTRSVTPQQMGRSPYFFNTIEDVLAAQITAF